MKRTKLLLAAVILSSLSTPTFANPVWDGGCTFDHTVRPWGGWNFIPCWAEKLFH